LKEEQQKKGLEYLVDIEILGFLLLIRILNHQKV